MAYKEYSLMAKKGNYGATRKASQIKYIVIHYTGQADSKTDTAKNNATYFSNNVLGASAHDFVDDTTVYHSVPYLTVAYSVGGAKYSDHEKTGGATMYGIVKNANSISVEICCTKGKFSKAAVENAKTLVKSLMKKFNIPASKVYRHFDVNGKHCPAYWMGNDTNNKLWKEFKKSLEDVPIVEEKEETKVYASVNTSSGVRMRNISGVILYTLSNKTKVEVIKKDATTMAISGTKYKMAKVKYKGETGYIAQKYLAF